MLFSSSKEKDKNLNFSFQNKAKTLEFLKTKVKLSHVPDFFYFSVKNWQTDKTAVYQKALYVFNKGKVIIRSSAYTEDSSFSAMAGVYESVPHVKIASREVFFKAVEKVIKSYKRANKNHIGKDYVLIQCMVEDISMSGVLFTQDLNTGAPYYVINYDDETGRTDTVTSGAAGSNRTLLVFRDAVKELRSERFKALLMATKEVEGVTKNSSLDIEFALDKQYKVYLLQVRQISTSPNWRKGIAPHIKIAIIDTQKFIKQAIRPVQGLYGIKTIFGRMPDWNPAEMIGTTPRPLALSLYRYLITDYAWWHARKLMGYCPAGKKCLMVSLFGHPYIDVRLSFNSFLPAGLNHTISEKLINAWLIRLSEHKELHDKIEFDIAITALTFDFNISLKNQVGNALTNKEKDRFRNSLFTLTNNLLTGRVSSISNEMKKIRLMEERRGKVCKNMQNNSLNEAAILLNDCVELGTVPFSILARHAFIAKSFLHSFVRCGIASECEILAFQKSIKTIAGNLVDDFDLLVLKKISAKRFMHKYGHLRPGTYDILSRRYDQRENLLKGAIKKLTHKDRKIRFQFSVNQLKEIDRLLKTTGFGIDAEMLIEYIKDATIGREYAKFSFTKNVSDSLEIISSWGKCIGMGKEELSFLDIESILMCRGLAASASMAKRLKKLSDEQKRKYETALLVHLPYLIEMPQDVAIVPLLLHKPNFITKKTARGSCILLKNETANNIGIAGHIVLIEGADPGFDWIFSRNIEGLITMFGGANSHMAIRCAEFGIPAAIGCGEQIFDRALRSREIELNCAEGRITAIEGN